MACSSSTCESAPRRPAPVLDNISRLLDVSPRPLARPLFLQVGENLIGFVFSNFKANFVVGIDPQVGKGIWMPSVISSRIAHVVKADQSALHTYLSCNRSVSGVQESVL